MICVHDGERLVILAVTPCGACSGLSALIWQPSAAEMKVRNGGSLGGWGSEVGPQCISASQRAVMNGCGITGHQQLGGRWSSGLAVAAGHVGEASFPLRPASTCRSTCGSTLERLEWVDPTIRNQRKWECFTARSLNQTCDVLRLVSFFAFWNNCLFLACQICNSFQRKLAEGALWG